jgi:hypothetical protein
MRSRGGLYQEDRPDREDGLRTTSDFLASSPKDDSYASQSLAEEVVTPDKKAPNREGEVWTRRKGGDV